MSARDLSGSWSGIYNYPHSQPSNGFEVELRDAGGVLTGECAERSEGDSSIIAHAIIEGSRQGDAVTFTKSYDTLASAARPVQYAGALRDDGDEISGRWTIPGDWSGSFIMTRRPSPSVAAERRAGETVR